ncbi:hypothetical protein [Streptomyces sp. MNP-20]|uniref:hypothetical protein n=1 Tax=Streptomyces sp. MNP-20 TaxID=2721165 RepID=UPI00155753D4|nr:hypothetical protein [Streptomyces sp. MNP-20]
MAYTIKYSRTTNHIDGVAIRSTGTGDERDGVVGYYAQNACGSLTRARLAQGETHETLAGALEAARKGTRKLCKTCEKAALAQLAAEAAKTEDGDDVDEVHDVTARTGKFKISLTPLALDFLAGTACLQGDEEPEVRAEIRALPVWKSGAAVGWVSYYTLEWLSEYIGHWLSTTQSSDAEPGEQRAAQSAYAKISSQYLTARRARGAAVSPADQETSKGDRVTGKLKLGEVRGDVRIGAVPGGSAIHALKPEADGEGRWVPMCPARTKTPIQSWGPAIDQKPALELCAGCSKVVPTGDVEVTEESVKIPGLGKSVTRRVVTPVSGGTEEGTGEEKNMAAKAMNKAAQDAAAAQVRNGIERLPSLVLEDKGESAKELEGSLKDAVDTITGRGAAGLKETLRKELEKAVKAARAAKRKADKAAKPATGTAVATRATTDLSTVKELPALYERGFTTIVEAAKKKLAAGTDVATVLVEIRSCILDKDEDPDLPARQQITRNAAGDLYALVKEQLPERGEDEQADMVRDTLDGVETDARRAARTITVEYVRRLDVEPDPESETYQDDKDRLEEERAKYSNALKMFPADFEVEDRDYLGHLILSEDGEITHRPIKWSERVFDYYAAMGKPIARITRAEEYAEERRKKTQRKKELAAAVEAEEITQEEADATLNAPQEEKAPKESDPTQRLKNAFEKRIKAVKRLDDEGAKATQKDDLISLLAALRKEIDAI